MDVFAESGASLEWRGRHEVPLIPARRPDLRRRVSREVTLVDQDCDRNPPSWRPRLCAGRPGLRRRQAAAPGAVRPGDVPRPRLRGQPGPPQPADPPSGTAPRRPPRPRTDPAPPHPSTPQAATQHPRPEPGRTPGPHPRSAAAARTRTPGPTTDETGEPPGPAARPLHHQDQAHSTVRSNAASESLNRLAKLEARLAYGFRNPANQQRRVRIACTRGYRRRSHTATTRRAHSVTGPKPDPG